jgi:hypothetical protein
MEIRFNSVLAPTSGLNLLLSALAAPAEERDVPWLITQPIIGDLRQGRQPGRYGR